MPVEAGIQMYSRKVYASYLISNLFSNFPLGQVLLKYNADRNKMGKDIGIPNAPEVISGNTGLGASDVMALATAESYMQDFHTSYTDDGKVIGEIDTDAQIANPTTDSSDQHFGNAEWRRFELQHEMLVRKSSVNSAKAKAGADDANRGRAVLDVFGNAIKERTGVHVTNIATRIYAGSPTNQNSSKWNDILGIDKACHASNIYARLNRSLTANLQWRGNRDTTARSAVFKDLCDYARYTATLGNGVTGGLQALGRQSALKCAFTPSANFIQFKNEAEAKGGAIIVHLDKQSEFGAYGLTGEAVQYGDTLCFVDKNVAANSVQYVNPADITVAFERGKQMTVSSWVDLNDYARGALQAYKCTITSSLFFIVHNPINQFLFTAVS